jgi:tetratricopeptide (TPR) repeat protein
LRARRPRVDDEEPVLYDRPPFSPWADRDPDLIEARSRLAHYYFLTSNTQQWIEQRRVVATLAPENPRLEAFRRDPTAWHVDPQDAIESYRTALENDPYSTMGHLNLGLMLFAAERLEEALTEFRKMVELNPAVGWDREIEISRVLIAQERYEEAYAAIMRLPPEARDYGFALLHREPGMLQQADAALARLQAHSGDRMHSIRVAEALCIRGRHDEALDTLHRARDALERDESILSRIWYFQLEMIISPFLAPLHPDRRWQALIAKPEGDSAEEIIERLGPASRTAAAEE